jgi:DNA-binding response OmpR family regulator
MDTHAHILFAEDDPDTRELIHLVLRRAGFRVSATGSPAEVLTLAATERFDALLLDNWMPELTGFELCRQTVPSIKAPGYCFAPAR